MTDITNDRMDWLTAQFVWAIENEGAWYGQTGVLAESGDFYRFCRGTTEYIERIRRQYSYRITTSERVWVTLALWVNRGGKLDDVTPAATGGNWRYFSHFLSARRDTPDSLETEAPETEAPETEAPETEIIEQENSMSATAFTTKHFVFGKDVSTMSEVELIDAIKRVEAEIADLNSVKTESKKIAAKRDELQKMLAEIVRVLDGE